MADSTTIRVSRRTHQAVSAHVQKAGTSADEVISAALRALDKRDARWTAAGLDATMLLATVTGLPNGCDMCATSPAVDEEGA